MKLGLALPFFHALGPAEYVALAREAEARGYDTAWTAEVAGQDAFTTVALLASQTTRLRMATGVVPVQTRTPVVLGMTAATLANVAPGRIALGLGVSSPIIVGQWHGLPFRKPLQQLREAVQVIRRVLAGERVNFEGGPSLTVLGVIPARLESKRLPRKVLRPIAGRPMICHVYERARQAASLGDLVVATDADEVVEVCRCFGIPAVMTSAEHPSGTDRVWEVAQKRNADVYVNIQGDEPLITPGHIERLIEPFRTQADAQVTTLCIRATADEEPNPNVNKVVFGARGRALYFSKHPIPYDRDGRGVTRYKHIGLYAYRRAALEAYHRMPPSPLELAERLEQLRFLENGIGIVVVETDEPTIGVDTEEDLRAVEAHLASRRT